MITLCFNIIMNGQEMSKKFNKGEWSEFYVFIKILSDKKIFLLDDKLNKLESFYEVIKILRKDFALEFFVLCLSKKHPYNPRILDKHDNL